MLRQNRDSHLAAYVVWVPELGARQEDVASGAALVPDDRARHFWDPSENLGKEYGHVLATAPEPAWDVYMLFGKRVTWRARPPHPDFWMQQLGAAEGKAPRLDGATFAAQAARLLVR